LESIRTKTKEVMTKTKEVMTQMLIIIKYWMTRKKHCKPGGRRLEKVELYL
jgi:hypothetical protein